MAVVGKHLGLERCAKAAFGLSLLLCVGAARGAERSGTYRMRADQPQQVVKGIGPEVQNNSISSGNTGMPDEVVFVPQSLTARERPAYAISSMSRQSLSPDISTHSPRLTHRLGISKAGITPSP